MFTFMVSSLNYALRCSVVRVPGLIWMFEKRSEGWKKRSQTGNSLLLMSSQKRHFFLPRIHHKALCMTSDLVCAECGLKRHFWSISEAVAHGAQTFVTGQMSFPNWDVCVCVCVYTVKAFSVFSNTQEKAKRTNRALSGKIQVRISRHGVLVLNGTYIKTLTLTKTTSSVMIDNKSKVGN